MSERLPITDSPWFWVVLFSIFGLILLLLFYPKYRDLQSMRERQYQARERVQEDATNDPTRRAYSRPDATLIPLWPLVVLLGGVAAVAAAMLIRGRRGSHVDESSPP